MVNINTILLSSTILATIPLALASSDVSHHRSQRSIGNMFKRWFNGKSKPTGFQGTAQAYHPYSYGSYGQASSSYPSYSSYPVYPNYGYSQQNFATNGLTAGYPNYYNYPITASASHAYPSYSQAYAPQSANAQQNIDVYQVLDQLIQSAGLNPHGDHQSIQTKGDSFKKTGTSPVFSFKKLYSFPFYLSADGSTPDGYNQMPILKRNTRRMSPEHQFRYNLQQQQQIQQQQPKESEQVLSHQPQHYEPQPRQYGSQDQSSLIS